MRRFVYVCLRVALFSHAAVTCIWGSPSGSSGNRKGQTHSHSLCTSPASEHAHQVTPNA